MSTPTQTAYETYSVGSQGFCQFLESQGNMEISYTEIERIASVSPDAATFDRVWQDDCWWLDDTVAANGETSA